jgi:hypothetical protein
MERSFARVYGFPAQRGERLQSGVAGSGSGSGSKKTAEKADPDADPEKKPRQDPTSWCPGAMAVKLSGMTIYA